jgi:hypothetical protein
MSWDLEGVRETIESLIRIAGLRLILEPRTSRVRSEPEEDVVVLRQPGALLSLFRGR